MERIASLRISGPEMEPSRNIRDDPQRTVDNGTYFQVSLVEDAGDMNPAYHVIRMRAVTDLSSGLSLINGGFQVFIRQTGG